MFIVLTVFGIWLGVQVNWLRERREARRWIEEHETAGGWSRKNPEDVVITRLNGTKYRDRLKNAPWGLRMLGESRMAYIRLDKSKLAEADIPRIDRLRALFPEAKSVVVDETIIDIDVPGRVHNMAFGWPPTDARAYLKYPSRIVDGKLINEPITDSRKSGAVEQPVPTQSPGN